MSNKDKEKDKPKDKLDSNKSIYDDTTGKFGVRIDIEFVIEGNKCHEDNPNSVIKQEINEKPGLMDDHGMDYMKDGIGIDYSKTCYLLFFKLRNTIDFCRHV